MKMNNTTLADLNVPQFSITALEKVKPNFNGSIKDFIDLDVGDENYQHKMVVIKNSITESELLKFNLKCAMSVLNLFTDIFPEEDKFLSAVEYLSNLEVFENFTKEQEEIVYANTYHLLNARRMARDNELYAASYVPQCFLCISQAILGQAPNDDVSTMAVMAADTASKPNQRKVNFDFLKEIL